MSLGDVSPLDDRLSMAVTALKSNDTSIQCVCSYNEPISGFC